MTEIERGQTWQDPNNAGHVITIVRVNLGTDGKPWGWWLIRHSYPGTRAPAYYSDSHESYIRSFTLIEEN